MNGQQISAAGHGSSPVWRDTSRALALLDRARRSLEADPRLARLCLEQLSSLVSEQPLHGSARPGDRVPATPDAAKGGLAAWQFRRVAAYVDANLADGLPVRDLAAVARVSVSHFSRAFKASTGETPHAYILGRRLLRAQQQMIETRDPLSQIASACGLTDQAHLTRLFRRMLGTTPLAWRRLWQAAS